MVKRVTREWLLAHPDHVFVFGDNQQRRGRGGAAALRDLPNTYGFITKRWPGREMWAYFTPTDYRPVFQWELIKLQKEIEANPDKTYLISRLGAGLANRYKIWEIVIKPGLQVLKRYSNVVFLWEDNDA